jgi:hypothetical protein
MIYSILPFLALSVSALKTSPADIKNAKNSFNKLDTHSKARVNKARITAQSKVGAAVPIGFGAKLAKYHGARDVASTKKVDLTAIDTEIESNHLRALHMRDNFLEYNMWSDAACTQSDLTFGSLVNHCANEMNEDTGEKRSSFVKVNKKTKTLVELTYEGYDCKGIPTKVEDLLEDMPEFKEFGECFYHESTDDSPSAYYSLNYLSTYPDREAVRPDMFGSFTYQEKRCTGENKNYFEYFFYPLDMLGIEYGTCIPDGTMSYMYDKSFCPSQHNLYVYFWMSADCTGEMIYVAPLLSGAECKSDDDDYDGDDDDDDDDYDDDGFDDVKVIENQYCT